MNVSKIATFHGVFISVFDVGVFLIGESGIGKSDLALSMLDRGHAFICDDITEFTTDGNALIGRSPALLKNFLNIRGLGVINVSAIFGESAVLQEQTLSVVVELQKPTSSEHAASFDHSSWSLLGVSVPFFCLPLSTMRPCEVLLEVLVRNYQQMQKGNDTNMIFIENHHKMLSESP